MKQRSALLGLDKSESGTAVIEAAVVLPVLILIMVGIADFGRAYATLSAAQKSLRGAARYLSMLPPAGVCGWGLDKAKNLALYGDVNGSGKLLIEGWKANDITLQEPTSCAGATSLGVIRLSAEVPYTALIWQVAGLPDRITMTTSHEQRWIGE